MGAMPSCLPRYGCCVPRHSPNTCRENHTSTPKFKGHKRNISAAFNLADLADNTGMDQVNINTASEEELMTLPMINRHTAMNIIEYRKQIGSFKKVEDLALVSGVGATKLNHIRLEITVGKRKLSENYSTSSSQNDISIQDNISRSSCKSQRSSGLIGYGQYNVNTSNVFQLMKVKGISQGIAENIVAYRDKKGPYRSLDQLVKVKGVTHALLSAIRPHLIIGDEQSSGSVPSYSSHYNNNKILTRCPNSHTEPNLKAYLANEDDLSSLYGPLASKSFRKKKRPFFFKRHNRPVFRMASWCLDRCGVDKSNNPGVKEVFAMTVLENGLALTAVQDLSDKQALQTLCDELNNPTIPNVKKWSGHRGYWKCVTSDPIYTANEKTVHSGFVFDSSRDIELQSSYVLEPVPGSKTTPFVNKPFLAIFQVMTVEMIVVNLNLTQGQEKTIPSILEAIEEKLESLSLEDRDEKGIVIVGNFNTGPDNQECGLLHAKCYQNCIKNDRFTDVSASNLEGTKCIDNIWISPAAHKMCTGTSDVVHDGLCSPWIPDGWGWGGVMSTHAPVWTELYTDQEPPSDPYDTNRAVEDMRLALKLSGVGDIVS